MPPDSSNAPHRDPSLIKLVVKAHAAREALMTAGDRSVAEVAAEQGFTRDYYRVLLRIAYLAPDIIAAILDGRQPVQLNRQPLARTTNLPLRWQRQREMLGFSSVNPALPHHRCPRIDVSQPARDAAVPVQRPLGKLAFDH